MKVLDRCVDIKSILAHVVNNFALYKIKKINFYHDPQNPSVRKDTTIYIKGVTLYNPITRKEIDIICKCDDRSMSTLSAFAVKISTSSEIVSFSTIIDVLEESIERTNIIKIVELLRNSLTLIRR